MQVGYCDDHIISAYGCGLANSGARGSTLSCSSLIICDKFLCNLSKVYV